MFTVKIIKAPSDLRRMKVRAEEGKLFVAVSQAAAATFGFPVEHFRASYVDEEGDRCVVSGEEEMMEAVHLFKQRGKVLKFRLELTQLEEVRSEPAPKRSEKSTESPSVTFVKDVTLPDGCEAQGTVHKVWRIKNSGNLPWPAGCSLTGDGLVASVPSLASGQETDVGVDINLPRKAGAYKRKFRLRSSPSFTGDTNLWVDVKVAPAPTPSAEFVEYVELKEGAAAEGIAREVWAFKNDGKFAWPSGSKLVFVKGKLTPESKEIPLPEAQVGQTVQVSANVLVPKKPGHYKALFHLKTGDDVQFKGHFQAWCTESVKPKVSKPDFLDALPFMLKDEEVLATVKQLLGLTKQAAKRNQMKKAKQEAQKEKEKERDHRVAKQARKAAKQAKKAVNEAAKVAAKQAKKAAKKAKKAAKHLMKQIRVEFVEDVTIADQSQVAANSTFRKTWRLKNTGPVPLESAQVVWKRGKVAMAGDAKQPSTFSCAVGATIDVSVNVQAPARAGRAKGVFRVIVPGGRVLPLKLWVDVVVNDPANDEGDDNDIERDDDDLAPVQNEPAGSASEALSEAEELPLPHAAAVSNLMARCHEMGIGHQLNPAVLESLLGAANGDLATVVGWLLARP